MNNFEDILNEAPESVERPKPIPVGSYQWMVQGQPRFDKSRDKQTPYVEFTVSAMMPLEDVDADALGEFGGPPAVQGKQQRLTFYTTPDAIWRLDAFLFEHLGIEFGTSRREAISMAAGRAFVGKVRHSPSKDGSTLYANITETAAL